MTHENLRRFEVQWDLEDSAATDPQLVCTVCNGVLCDVEHEDSLGVLVDVALHHLCGSRESE